MGTFLSFYGRHVLSMVLKLYPKVISSKLKNYLLPTPVLPSPKFDTMVINDKHGD